MIDVYPNPAGDHVTIQTPTAVGNALILYDAAGRVVASQNLIGNTSTLSLKQLPAGIYYLVIRQPDGQLFKKEIVHSY